MTTLYLHPSLAPLRRAVAVVRRRDHGEVGSGLRLRTGVPSTAHWSPIWPGGVGTGLKGGYVLQADRSRLHRPQQPGDFGHSVRRGGAVEPENGHFHRGQPFDLYPRARPDRPDGKWRRARAIITGEVKSPLICRARGATPSLSKGCFIQQEARHAGTCG